MKTENDRVQHRAWSNIEYDATDGLDAAADPLVSVSSSIGHIDRQYLAHQWRHDRVHEEPAQLGIDKTTPAPSIITTKSKRRC